MTASPGPLQPRARWRRARRRAGGVPHAVFGGGRRLAGSVVLLDLLEADAPRHHVEQTHLMGGDGPLLSESVPPSSGQPSHELKAPKRNENSLRSLTPAAFFCILILRAMQRLATLSKIKTSKTGYA